MKTAKILGLVVALALVLGCGGDDPAGPGGNGGPEDAGMSATLDGVSWTAVTASAFRTGDLVAVAGASMSGVNGIGLGFHVSKASDHPIQTGSTANGNVNDLDGNLWVASGNEGSGLIRVTTLTDTRIAGTFEFTALRRVGTGPPATRVVTAGEFDLPLTTQP